MGIQWFKRKGILYVPATIIGWLVLAGALVVAVYEFRLIDSTSHSASDTLINFVFRLIIIGAIYSLIGYLTARAKRV